MTNVKGEHFKFDKVKSMLQNKLLNKEEQEKKIITSKCMYHESNTHSSVYCFSKKIMSQMTC